MSSLRASLHVLLAAAALTAAACKDQQTMYSYEEEAGAMASDAAPPAPPSRGAGMQALPPGHPPLAGGAAMHVVPDMPPADRATLAADTAITPVEFVGLSFPLPSTWTSRPPSSGMRLAEFAVPPAGEGAPGADLVLFHFGANQGGDALSNVKRWVGQMELDPDSAPVVYQQKRDDLTITEVICFGTQKPSGMGVGPSEPVPGSGLHGLIVEGGPQGSLFLKITGDAATIRSIDPAVATLIAGIEAAAQ
ncbi:MAG: hypothetical protein PWP23_1659 [Candidatus Sumerlaeota bacterium]|nr:hypothetical protein [Candidatus Sumerlaeota bacterium]